MLFEIIQITLCFSLIDRVLTHYKVQGVYYLLHALHNGLIVAATWPDVVHTLTDIQHLSHYSTNWLAIQLCCALHVYHTALYWRTFRFDDWLHHGLMIGIALPLSSYFETHSLLGMTLFFTTGLPGGIDYTMLALGKNGYMDRMTEKRINAFLNVWIRSPGCVAVAVLGYAHASPEGSTWQALANSVSGLLTFWNGQYFMRQVVENNITLKIESLKTAEPKAQRPSTIK